ncbi:Unknown protein, partial [Striga hermonthica]
KIVASAITEPTKKRQRVRPTTAGTSASQRLLSPGHLSDANLLKKIVPGSRKRQWPSEVENPTPKAGIGLAQASTSTIPQPPAFSTHLDPLAQSAYLVSTFSSNETDRWGEDNKLRAEYCVKRLAE